MADIVYQCTVTKTHTRKVSADSKTAPYCCGKPMVRVQSSTPVTTPTPAATPAHTPTPAAAKPAQQASGAQKPSQGQASQQNPKK